MKSVTWNLICTLCVLMTYYTMGRTISNSSWASLEDLPGTDTIILDWQPPSTVASKRLMPHHRKHRVKPKRRELQNVEPGTGLQDVNMINPYPSVCRTQELTPTALSICILIQKWINESAIERTNVSKLRSDYKYSQEVNGWLKLHIVPASWHHARRTCHTEGGVLASLVSKPMVLAMNTIMNDTGTLPCEVGVVYTGIHATFSSGFYYSIEGVRLSTLPVRWTKKSSCSQLSFKDCLTLLPNGTINDVDCSGKFPFICYIKKSENKVNLDTCGTVDPGYRLDNRTGSCYKFHRVGATWKRAFEICSAEDGYLAIINSDIEAKIFNELFKKNPKSTVTSDNPENIYLGIVDWEKSETWMTIHGQTLEEAGYANWAPDEPNNYNKIEFCCTMSRTGLWNDQKCDHKYAFICEKSPSSLL